MAQLYLKKAQEEDQKAALAFETSGMGEEYERHRSAAKAAKNIAEEMKRREYILEHGKESDYRSLMFGRYGKNNPEVNKIAAYYAEKFNDQDTLNWLKLQHPAAPPRFDANGLAMMTLLPEGEAAEEVSQVGGAPEKSVFDQTSDIENGTDESHDGGNVGAREKAVTKERGLIRGGEPRKNANGAINTKQMPTIRGRLPIIVSMPEQCTQQALNLRARAFPIQSTLGSKR